MIIRGFHSDRVEKECEDVYSTPILEFASVCDDNYTSPKRNAAQQKTAPPPVRPKNSTLDTLTGAVEEFAEEAGRSRDGKPPVVRQLDFDEAPKRRSNGGKSAFL